MTRKTITGRPLEEFAIPATISLNTKVPGKWVIVDCETGDVWTFNNTIWPVGLFQRANETERREALEVLQRGETK